MSCGCHDTPLSLNNCGSCSDCSSAESYVLPACEGGESCEEVLPTDCVPYQGPHLPALGVLHNDRLTDILLRLNRIINDIDAEIVETYYTLTTITATTVAKYLAKGPIYKSLPGATSSGTTVTVASTTGLVVGMTVAVTNGTGEFVEGTTVTSITDSTSFEVSVTPTTALSGTVAIVTATGDTDTIFLATAAIGSPVIFKAYTGSPVIISGDGALT